MDIPSIRKAYKFYAPIYNYIFGGIVNEGRRKAVARFPQEPGHHYLEIGVGTGLSLPFYKNEVRVTGIDVSREMLEKARRRYQNSKYPQVGPLLEMDAEELDFEDNRFDGVVAMYVASVVPNPEKMMAEMFRVCKPGGRILVVNHFTSSRKLVRGFENRMAPLSRRLGFRPDFSLEEFIACGTAKPIDVSRVNIGGYWKLVEFAKPAGASGDPVSPENHSPELGEKPSGEMGLASK